MLKRSGALPEPGSRNPGNNPKSDACRQGFTPDPYRSGESDWRVACSLGVWQRQLVQRITGVREEPATRNQGGRDTRQGERSGPRVTPVECSDSQGEGKVEAVLAGFQDKILGSNGTKGQRPRPDLADAAAHGL